MAKNTTAKENGGVSGIAFVRLDIETAYALAYRCTQLGLPKQQFLLTIIRRSLGLPDAPEPDPATSAGVPEVTPVLNLGKDVPPVVAAQIARQLPEIQVVQEPEVLPAQTSSHSRGSRLPANFRLLDTVLIQYAVAAGVFNPQAELDQFCDHHTAKGSIFKDWSAAWRTWCRNAVKYQQQRAPNAASIHSERMRVSSQIFGPRPEKDLFGVTVEGRAKKLPG